MGGSAVAPKSLSSHELAGSGLGVHHAEDELAPIDGEQVGIHRRVHSRL